MSDVLIGLCQNGRDSTLLTASVGNGLQVKWQLSDSQLLHLVSQGVSILKSRAEHNAYVAGGYDSDIRKILGDAQ